LRINLSSSKSRRKIHKSAREITVNAYLQRILTIKMHPAPTRMMKRKRKSSLKL
jgi:hypothetical protein